MNRLIVFVLLLWGLTIGAFYVCNPVFWILFIAQLICVASLFVVGIFNVIVYDIMKYRIYILHKGWYSIWLRWFVPLIYIKKQKIIKKQFVFDDNCRYDSNKIGGINKLFGISFGWHHRNSIRFGWRYNYLNDKIDIYTYIYRDGERLMPVGICCVKPNRLYTYCLKYEFNPLDNFSIRYSFEVICNAGDSDFDKDNEFIISITDKTLIPRWGYKLHPYFGGSKPAPHTMKIKEVYL